MKLSGFGNFIVRRKRSRAGRNPQTGAEIRTLNGPPQSMMSLAFSPDGRRIASGGGNLQNPEESADVKIWNAETGEETMTLKGHAGWVLALSFGPDGKRVASGSWDKTVKIWDVEKGTEEAQLKEAHTDAVAAVAFSPDGSRIVSGSGDETVGVWAVWDINGVKTGRELLALRGHGHAIPVPGPPEAKEERSYCINYVGFSRDGHRITSASCDGTVMLWEAEK